MVASVRIRPLHRHDIPDAMRLKDEAEWNQTSGDWARFLEHNPTGCFAAERNGCLVGTAATIIYGGTGQAECGRAVAWIAMVLVDRRSRGEGIGTNLLETAIAYLDSRGIGTMKLDATPQGRPLYERLGFREEYCVERWSFRRAGPTRPDAEEPEGRDGQGAGLPDDLLARDREVFGADRGRLLRSFAEQAPDMVLCVRADSGALRGYCLGRRGSAADHMGPCAAEDGETTAELLDGFLQRSTRELVYVDEACPNPWIRGLLRERGFRHSRPLTRMYRGSNACPGQPARVCAIAGPEFG